VSSCFDSAISHHCAAELKIYTLESDMMPICKSNVIRAAEPGFQTISTHTASEFIKAPVVVRAILWLNMEVSYWRMM
jgi:hypothetical protein